MGSKIDRIGEEGVNNFGSRMVIVGYRMNRDIDVYFPEYDWTAKNATYQSFKKGNIACTYERRVFNIGYIGKGKYKVYENGKMTKCYEVWNHMLQRCYDSKYHEKYSTYKDCEVVEEWLNLQNFGNWFDDNYYEVKNEKMCLDKDILNKGNKIYSPNNCIFVPDKINTLFVKCNKSRGDYPIGVCYHKSIGKFIARCSIYDFETNKSKNKHLGYYDTPNEAFKIYKQFKEKYIKEVADCYKDFIPIKLYDAMYNYKIDIDD